jgi:hypothetical protein
MNAFLVSGRSAFEDRYVLEQHPVTSFFKDAEAGNVTINFEWYVEMVMTFTHCPGLLLAIGSSTSGLQLPSGSVTSPRSRLHYLEISSLD